MGPFGPITYTHESTYQIIGLEFGYDLGRCQAPKTAQLVGQPPLCVAKPYLNKEFIKRTLIINPNIHHALKKKKNTYNMLKTYHNIKENK